MLSIKQKESMEEKKLRQALQESERRHALIAQIVDEGLWSWDLSCDHVDYSARWKSMVGCQGGEINHSPVEWLVRVHPADIAKLKQNLSNCWHGRIKQFAMEYSLLHKDGQYRSMFCKCIALDNSMGEVTHLIGSQADISDRKKTEAQLNYDALHDQLTNLPNRQLFIQKLKELSQLEHNPDYCFGILYLDLDRFKHVNHNFGHLVGDRLLVEVVRRLESCLGTHDLLTRIGGDEFAILVISLGEVNYPSEVAAHIQQRFSEPIKIAEHSILISTSIGIAAPCAVNGCSTVITSQDLIKSFQNAEIAMHQAKEKGQACNRVYESWCHLQALEKTRSEDDLRQAIEQEQFELHYQPIVRLDDQQLVGFEALIRWHHPVRGLIYPADFITLAEDTGLITPIGWWVLRSACLQMVEWQQQNPGAEPIFISVNITGKQFSQPYAGDIIAQILEETGFDPHCLKLEITESEIIENITLVLATVEKLKNLGVQLSMDDFGTGYSSLSYLHCLPVDTLKIDRSFIQGIESDRHQLELVKTIIKLAEVFDLDLIAEGIESEIQSDQLLELRCKYGQGYLFSKPVTCAIAATLIS
ncbi:MAG: GGDEF and EAL domain-containing protein [Cyanobacteria bacterium P01_E01_bin.35]